MEPFAENVVVLAGASRGIGEQMAYILAARLLAGLGSIYDK